MTRGVRGAICAEQNSREAIFAATGELLHEMLARNDIDPEHVCSIFLTATPDLNADFPAYAVRENGLTGVPILCAVEINVPGALARVVRILIHLNSDKQQNEIKHVYLGEAASLRPDLKGE